MFERLVGTVAVLALLGSGGCAEPRGEPARPAPPARAPAPRGPRPPQVVPVAPPAEAALDADLAESPAAAEVVRTLASLRDSVVETHYQGDRDIRPDEGYYAWDCSGMAAWVLKKSARTARRSLRSGRPLAKRFYHAIDRAPTDRSRRGWQQLEHVSQARPGDLFAWLRSPASKSHITGHVGFFVERPTPLADYPHIYRARIADATGLPHGDDTRPRDSDGGFGFGTILFVTDDTGETIAYGWHGMNSLKWGFMPARVIYGRVTK